MYESRLTLLKEKFVDEETALMKGRIHSMLNSAVQGFRNIFSICILGCVCVICSEMRVL